MKKLIVIGFLLFLVSWVIFTTNPIAESKVVAVDDMNLKTQQFLIEKGYKIIKIEGKVDSYELKKDTLLGPHYGIVWGVQSIDLQNLMGKKIDTYGFVVKKHPLDSAIDNNKCQTKVWVLVDEDKVVGGYSLPDYDEPYYGGVYSMDGKTLEEITGEDFQTWSKKWVEKVDRLTSNKKADIPLAKDESSEMADIYILALDSFMPIDKGLNGEMKYIAIEMKSLTEATKVDKKEILKYFEKYKVKVIDESFETLKAKGMVMQMNSLEGILIRVDKGEKKSDDEFVIEGSKFRSGLGAIWVKCVVKKEKGKWTLKSSNMMAIS